MGSVKLRRKEGIGSPKLDWVTLRLVGIIVECGGETTTLGNTVEIDIWLIIREVTPSNIEVPALPIFDSTDCSSMFLKLFWGWGIF